MIGRIIFGIILCIIGFICVKKPEWPLDLIGFSGFAEKFMMGGSRFFYQVIGIIIIFVGFLAITNLHGQVINWMLDFIY